MAQQTTLGVYGGPTRTFGSFAGKAEVSIAAGPGSRFDAEPRTWLVDSVPRRRFVAGEPRTWIGRSDG